MTVSRWLKRQFLRRSHSDQPRSSGFTLIELLIALVIGSVIISGLMFIVTEMLKIERRETAVDNTQRDMKRALEYIASDIAEAIYVYVPDPDTGDWPAPIQVLDDVTIDNIENVILAFWRPDFEEDANLPADCGAFADDLEQQCLNLLERRGYYTLVAYEIVPNGEGDVVWDGQARLIRHELPKYTDASTLEEGYAGEGPFNATGAADFLREPVAGNAGELGIQSAVLVDFVANPEDTAIDDDAPLCEATDLVRIPADPDTSRSFFACVRAAVAGGTVEGSRDNQNLELFLRGDFEPREGSSVGLGTAALNENSLLPTLRTGVFVQGIIGYNPDN
ncbi:MAG: prepilin-type N-terminal cleavage/methylation domain-containing protein [Leptolyngbya sp. SIO1E4]|nr:prepilin-type N-terminal cleavage/methylation domain-containing protein [Leptolyngbya sp. SIO1E4]